MIFTHKNLEDIRRLTVEDVQTCINLAKKEDKSSCIPQYQIILDVCPIEVIIHFLQLRKRMWKTSTFVFARSVSGIPLTSESLFKVISIQLKGMGLAWDDLELVRCSSNLTKDTPTAPKSFDKTSNILFRKYHLENKLLESSLELRKQETFSELTQDLYNTPLDQRLEQMTNGFIRLELLDCWRRNILNSSSRKDF
jgi:hypothetical protein